jgi:hypothetical protein
VSTLKIANLRVLESSGFLVYVSLVNFGKSNLYESGLKFIIRFVLARYQ